MPITNHVTSLELSTKLESLGVPQESIFYHFNGKVLMNHELKGRTMSEDNRPISAYLASELGEFIGNALENGEDKNIPKELQTTSIQDIWKPDYLAKLLIWLLENHLISVEELGN